MEGLSRKYTVGRDTGCDIAIADDSVSRLYAELALFPDGQVLLTDNHSRNGTAVIRNGKPEPVDRAYVSCKDQVQFGDVVLLVGDLLESVGAQDLNRAEAAPALAGPWPVYGARVAAFRRQGWRESIIGAMVLACLTLLAVDPPVADIPFHRRDHGLHHRQPDLFAPAAALAAQVSVESSHWRCR